MEIKERIEQYRLAKGMTVQAFEKKCGFSNGSWAKSGDLSELFLIRFVNAFPEVAPSWLLKGEEEPELEQSQTGWEDESKMRELLGLCKSLVTNYQQRDQVMGQLVSMVNNLDINK